MDTINHGSTIDGNTPLLIAALSTQLKELSLDQIWIFSTRYSPLYSYLCFFSLFAFGDGGVGGGVLLSWLKIFLLG